MSFVLLHVSTFFFFFLSRVYGGSHDPQPLDGWNTCLCGFPPLPWGVLGSSWTRWTLPFLVCSRGGPVLPFDHVRGEGTSLGSHRGNEEGRIHTGSLFPGSSSPSLGERHPPQRGGFLPPSCASLHPSQKDGRGRSGRDRTHHRTRLLPFKTWVEPSPFPLSMEEKERPVVSTQGNGTGNRHPQHRHRHRHELEVACMDVLDHGLERNE